MLRGRESKKSVEKEDSAAIDARCPPNCPAKLRPLFMSDKDDENYIVPFSEPDELQEIFSGLEE